MRADDLERLQAMAKLLGGELINGCIRCPGPGEPPSGRALKVLLARGAPDSVIIFDTRTLCPDFQRNRAHVVERLAPLREAGT
jgi:hypothetical protein